MYQSRFLSSRFKVLHVFIFIIFNSGKHRYMHNFH